MTGICGLWRRDGRSAADGCARMRRALKIYGPHREGRWDGGDISLGIQLFRTLPEDRFDRQPLGGGGRFVLTADLRLDNRPELAAELGWTAEQSRDAADADFVLAAWERWGEGALDRMIGDWALAVWDADKHTLTLARDMMGQRPLFYHAGRGFFAFASMAKGLHALPDVPVGPNLDTLRDYLALAPMRGPGSFFKGIARVEPGGKTVLHADGRIETGRWYDWNRIVERTELEDGDCIEQFRALFDRAVADRLRASGRIACQLSGGMDSTAVTATAARLLAEKGMRLTAFTHVPTAGWKSETPVGRLCNEGETAAATAAGFANIDHVPVDSGARQIGEDTDATFHYCEFPMLNLCNQVWTDEILRQAQGHGVLLSGAAGNMTISQNGFERLHGLLRRGRLGELAHEALALRRRRTLGAFGVVKHTLGPWLPRRLFGRVNRAFQASRGRHALDLSRITALPANIATDAGFLRHLESLGFDPTYQPHASVRRMAEFVLRRFDHPCLYYKGCLARYGISQRDPTSDRRLIEFSLSLPERMWLRDGETKWLYRRAFRDRVPEAIMQAKKKGYQGADWPERLRRSKDRIDAELALGLADPAAAELVDADFLRRMKNEPLTDLNPGDTATYRLKLLRGLSVVHFFRKARRSNSY